jgi:hypothetical protein
VEGSVYFNTVQDSIKVYNGSAWIPTSAPSASTTAPGLVYGETSLFGTNVKLGSRIPDIGGISGSDNVFVGSQILDIQGSHEISRSVIIGAKNFRDVGLFVGDVICIGNSNFVGDHTNNSTNFNNLQDIAIGNRICGGILNSGFSNIYIGDDILGGGNTTIAGSYNLVIGTNSLTNPGDSAGYNIAIGANSARSASSRNIYIGFGSGETISGADNIIIGAYGSSGESTGTLNGVTILGVNNESGSENPVMSGFALTANSTGAWGLWTGTQSGSANTVVYPTDVNFGTAGQVLTSAGNAAPPYWAAASGGGGVVVTAPQTIYVETTGDDTTGDGTVTSPFASLSRACSEIRNWIIGDPSAKVTIQMGSGTFLEPAPIEWSHPYGTNIEILGTLSAGTKPGEAELNGGGVTSQGRAQGAAANLAALTAYYTTNIEFSGTNGFLLKQGHLRIDRVLVSNSSTTNTNSAFTNTTSASPNGFTGSSCAIDFGPDVAITQWGFGVELYYRNSVNMAEARVTNCSTGIALRWGASANMGGLVLDHCNDGISVQGSSSASGFFSKFNNCITGLSINGGSNNILYYTTVNNPGSYPAFITEGAYVGFLSSTFNGSGSSGFRVINARVNINNCTFTNTTSTNSVQALTNASISAINTTVDGTYSPAINTSGNQNSYIAT